MPSKSNKAAKISGSKFMMKENLNIFGTKISIGISIGITEVTLTNNKYI